MINKKYKIPSKVYKISKVYNYLRDEYTALEGCEVIFDEPNEYRIFYLTAFSDICKPCLPVPMKNDHKEDVCFDMLINVYVGRKLIRQIKCLNTMVTGVENYNIYLAADLLREEM